MVTSIRLLRRGAAPVSGSGVPSYLGNGLLVFTVAYHLKRGPCCGSGCRQCPYEPKHVAGNTQVRP